MGRERVGEDLEDEGRMLEWREVEKDCCGGGEEI